jgi:hypothetical protein
MHYVQFGEGDDMELGLKEEEAFNVEALSPEMEATAMIRVTVRGLPNYRCVRHFPFSECRLLADGRTCAAPSDRWLRWTASR